MKKFLAVLLAAVMICISFVACSSETKTEETGNDTQQATLTMATNAEFPPYEYKEGDQVVGIDAEIAQAIADELGMKLEIVDTKFDARCFNIPKEEVANYFYWRQLDATRNSIQMVGQANFSHKEL